MSQKLNGLSRRSFAGAIVSAGTAASLCGQDSSAAPEQKVNAEAPPFGPDIDFSRKLVSSKLKPFAMNEVRLLPSVFKDCADANLGYVKRLDNDRLLHAFRINADLPSSSRPLGGWEKPDSEVRGHFVGHYLSACALLWSATEDPVLRQKGEYLVAELAKCQQKLTGGYLSAFPIEYFDRLNAGKKVWAPFYTIHKIMAGMYDMHEHCGNVQALGVLKGMADWADKWTAAKSEPHMQAILENEYGGMNDILYKLANLTGDDRYARAGDRFTKKKFFNPLVLRRDELKGLHANTHIPQVIGAAQRYEISSDRRFYDVADFFWWDVTGARSYVTGGTSNAEFWLTNPQRLSEELKRSTNTTEDCCAYNMLKLTRQLYLWNGDPRYFDYYERTLLNHRIPAIDRKTGATQYFLSLSPGAWKTFSTEDDSFWCCTGTGVEEFAKLNDSIYFHDGSALYVNLFIASRLEWKQKDFALRQETQFPASDQITLEIERSSQGKLPIHLRIPAWASGGMVSINGQSLNVTPGPGSYLTVNRAWKQGDRITMRLPMKLHFEAMPDDSMTQAFLYGPLVLAGRLGSEALNEKSMIGQQGPDLKKHPIDIPSFQSSGSDLTAWLKPVSGKALTFETTGQTTDVTFVPFSQVFGERYSIYWKVS